METGIQVEKKLVRKDLLAVDNLNPQKEENSMLIIQKLHCSSEYSELVLA